MPRTSSKALYRVSVVFGEEETKTRTIEGEVRRIPSLPNVVPHPKVEGRPRRDVGHYSACGESVVVATTINTEYIQGGLFESVF